MLLLHIALLAPTGALKVMIRYYMYQSVTYQYREFPVPGIFHFFGGIGTGIGKNWYRKKVSEPVSAKFGTGKSLGTGIGKIWYRKKVPEPVSEKFGTEADFCGQNFCNKNQLR